MFKRTIFEWPYLVEFQSDLVMQFVQLGQAVLKFGRHVYNF